MKNRIVVITARGGSKRIPKKNIKEFCGEPIIAYAIKAAKEVIFLMKLWFLQIAKKLQK